MLSGIYAKYSAQVSKLKKNSLRRQGKQGGVWGEGSFVKSGRESSI